MAAVPVALLLAGPLAANDRPEGADPVVTADWLYQVQGAPSVEDCRNEIRRTRRIAERIAKKNSALQFSAELARLAQAEKRFEAEIAGIEAELARAAPAKTAKEINPPQRTCDRLKEHYLAVRRIKREILFKSPELDFRDLLFAEVPYPQGAENFHESRSRSVMCAAEGGRLLILHGLHPGGDVRQLVPGPGQSAALFRPDLSFDGRRVVFSMKPKEERAYHLYEINVDGTRLRQVTRGLYDDLDPIYLPDGGLLFCSTRANNYAQCAPWAMSAVITRCSADGRDMYILSPGTEAEFSPSLLDDGRVIYTRWEYVDKPVQHIQSLWTMWPDGTAQTAYWGNDSPWPDHRGEARQIPGTKSVMFNAMAHHSLYKGSIAILDVSKGLNYPDGIQKVTGEIAWPEVGNHPQVPAPAAAADYYVSGRYNAYKTPYPLSRELFLVSARKVPPKLPAGGPAPPPGPFSELYLMDIHGNRELLFQGRQNVFYAQPLKPRTRPPVLPRVGDFPGPEKDRPLVRPGVFASSNVFQGLPEDVRRMGKKLRVIEWLPKNYSTGIVTTGGGELGAADACSAWGQVSCKPKQVGGDGGLLSGPATNLYGALAVKQVLGAVPIEADGSIHFEVPPARALYFQLLDAEDRTLITMQSWTSLRPGEQRTCVGCHRRENVAPYGSGSAQAMARPPSRIAPPPWGVRSLSYVRDIHPLLQRSCGSCHQGEEKARRALDLTMRPDRQWPQFAAPYVAILSQGQNAALERNGWRAKGPWEPEKTLTALLPQYNLQGLDEVAYAYAPLPPLKAMSYRSRLIDLASSGKHYGVKVPAADRLMLIAWIDTWCPCRSEDDIRALADPDPKYFPDWPSPPRLRTAPVVRGEYSQDEYQSQEDRLRTAGH